MLHALWVFFCVGYLFNAPKIGLFLAICVWINQNQKKKKGH